VEKSERYLSSRDTKELSVAFEALFNFAADQRLIVEKD